MSLPPISESKTDLLYQSPEFSQSIDPNSNKSQEKILKWIERNTSQFVFADSAKKFKALSYFRTYSQEEAPSSLREKVFEETLKTLESLSDNPLNQTDSLLGDFAPILIQIGLHGSENEKKRALKIMADHQSYRIYDFIQDCSTLFQQEKSETKRKEILQLMVRLCSTYQSHVPFLSFFYDFQGGIERRTKIPSNDFQELQLPLLFEANPTLSIPILTEYLKTLSSLESKKSVYLVLLGTCWNNLEYIHYHPDVLSFILEEGKKISLGNNEIFNVQFGFLDHYKGTILRSFPLRGWTEFRLVGKSIDQQVIEQAQTKFHQAVEVVNKINTENHLNLRMRVDFVPETDANAFAGLLNDGTCLIRVHAGLLVDRAAVMACGGHTSAELAGVMGHEISHCLYYQQESKRSWIVNFLSDWADVFILWSGKRKREKNADIEGQKLASHAGYDPQEQLNYRSRLSHFRPHNIPITHPSERSRVEQLKLYMPEAKKLFEEAQAKEWRREIELANNKCY